MPAAVLKPQKRILGDATKAHRNGKVPSPSAAKKRKLDPQSSPATKFKGSQHGVDRKIGSSQPKSQFEEEVLEKLTQDISGLKQKNSEKDQQWERPSLDDFDEGRESLCFQQIEAEEGSLHGGKTTVKLFGVTEVTSCDALRNETGRAESSQFGRPATLYSFMSPTFSIIFTSPPLSLSSKQIAKASRPTLTTTLPNINLPYNPCRW